MRLPILRSIPISLGLNFLFCGAIAFSQLGSASLRGVVMDSSGAVIPGATVTLTNTGTNSVRTVPTNPSGEYAIPSLVPGDYSLKIEFQGFKGFSVPTMTLHTGQDATMDATLTVGASNEQVVVTTEDLMLNTTSATVQTLISPAAVAHLPLNGRQFWQLAQLTPGSTYIPRGQSAQYNGSEIRARAVNVNTNGQSSIFTGWMLDGTIVTNMELGGTLIQPNVDALQEFSVKAGNMPAEYGYSPNMVVASLKSGTNRFHGSVFEYLRNDALDARNYFIPSRLSLKQNQFGFTFGGPAFRNKVFFFVDYQGTRLRTATPFNVVVASEAQRKGDFSGLLPAVHIKDPLTGNQFPGNVIPSGRISPQAQFLLQYMPLPTTSQGATSRFQYGASTALNNDEGDVKVDINVTSKDMIMGRYSINNNNEENPLPFPALEGTDLSSRAQDGTVRCTHVFTPNLLNVAQAAIYKSPFLFGAVLGGTDINGKAGIQGFDDPSLVRFPSFPRVTIAGYQQYQGSPSDQRPKQIQARMWQYSDSVHYIKGKHTMDLGMEWLRRVDTFGPGGGNSVGTFNFLSTYTGDAFGDFLLGYPASASRSAYLPLQGNHDNFVAWYADDVYRLRQDLTLTIGLRFQIDPWFKGVNYSISAFSPTDGKLILPAGLRDHPDATPLVATLTPIFSDRILYSDDLHLPDQLRPTSHDWNPRVGIAWSPGNSQKYVIRSGYGIYYVFPDTNLINNTKNVVPLQDSQSLFNATPTPNLTFGNFFVGQTIGTPNPHPGQPCPFGMVLLSCETPSVTTMPVSLKQQYVHQWNLSVQEQVSKGVSVTLAYVGNKTVHLQQGTTQNLPEPGPGTIQNRRPYPQWGPISMQLWSGTANYNAFQAQVEMRNWRGLTLLGAYTKSKCLDNGSDEGGYSAPQLAPLMYGVCDYDLPQSGSVSYDYVLPFGKGRRFLGDASSVLNALVADWRIGGIVTLQSGLPFTPTISTDTANTGAGGQPPLLVGKPHVTGHVECWFYAVANSGCANYGSAAAFAVPSKYTYGNSGRNILRADSLSEWDASLMKNIKIHESVDMQFRAEYFNVLNHPTFGAPVTNINVPSAGQVSSTLNSNRIGQFALKVSF